MRILLTGKRGQVGNELSKTLTQFGEVTATDKSEMDLSNPSQIRHTISQVHPELIVNAGAYTGVDRAESEPELAQAVNSIAPKILAEEAKKLGIVLIHYSTDYVYGGETKNTPYMEYDPPEPISVYGKTKLKGDQAIKESGALHLIFRTSWVYSHNGKSFLRTILQLAKEREELRVVNDQIGTPTWCRSIANGTGKVIKQLLDKGKGSLSQSIPGISGVYHMTCGGYTSWHAFAEAILELTEHDHIPQLLAIPTNEYPTLATRPTYSVLCNTKLNKVFGVELPNWKEALKQCIHAT